MPTRLELLTAMVEKDPDDTFLQYAIALEYVGANRLEEAAATLESLMIKSPDYPSGFHQAARVYERLERTADARRCYESGMACADRAGDPHAKAEMSMALAALQD